LLRQAGERRHGASWLSREGVSDTTAYFCRDFLTEVILNPFILTALVALLLTVPAFAEKLVDPAKVAPEYRDAAEKRRAEQLKQLECSHKADVAKVIARERTAFLLQCLEADAAK
jgi:hypothetical protein